jgi:hypothetical protein
LCQEYQVQGIVFEDNQDFIGITTAVSQAFCSQAHDSRLLNDNGAGAGT